MDVENVPPDEFDEVGTWDTRGSLPEGLVGSIAAVLDGQIYVIGGYSGSAAGTATSAVLRIDPETLESVRLGDFPIPISEGAAVVYQDTLLILGGNQANEVSIQTHSRSWRYEATSDTWGEWASLLDRRFRHTAHVVGDELIVAGGENFTNPPGDSIIIFRGRDRVYGLGPNRVFANPLVGGTVGDTLLVSGSLFETAIMGFVASESRWLDPVSSPVEGVATGGVLEGRVHAFTAAPRAEHRIWRRGLEVWLTAPPPPTGVERAAMVTYGGRLYLIGGADRQRQGVASVQVYTPPA